MKVLVVDDEPLIRLGLAATLEDAGYQVVEAADAKQAIGLLEANDGIEVVLTDVDMPGDMDGIRLAHYVRHRWPPVVLVVISGKIGVERHELPLGVELLSKPYSDSVIRRLLERMVPLQGGAA
jgi:CheY-like chemotaxis protein